MSRNAQNDHLTRLEQTSIHVFREAFANFRSVCMPWSMGKDSNVLIWLARKAFCGKIPFPLLHIDTTYEVPEMYDRLVPRNRPLHKLYPRRFQGRVTRMRNQSGTPRENEGADP